jgi:hypothetical protein
MISKNISRRDVVAFHKTHSALEALPADQDIADNEFMRGIRLVLSAYGKPLGFQKMKDVISHMEAVSG